MHPCVRNIRYQTDEHDMLTENAPISIQLAQSVYGARVWGQEVKGQGHTRPQLDLEAYSGGIVFDHGCVE